MMTQTLTPNAELVLNDGQGFIVSFPSGSVAANVEVRAGRVGSLSNPPSSRFDVYGDLYRIGFATQQILLKNVYVQLPYRSATAPNGGVCTCVARPYYPDPMPWMPDHDEFAVLANWQQLANQPPHDTGKYLACETKRIGYMICAYKS
ncbi:MAG: hypothetical protein R3F39_14525 [Myxococcota bacterium]